MTYNEFPKGSEWHKWDLHVHTPASFNSQYPDNWDLYVTELIKAIKKHEISVIATADYFTIEGYIQLLQYYDKSTNTLSFNGQSAQVYIIPGIELRLDIFNSRNESINYHVIFDPENCGVDFIKEHFLEKLKTTYRSHELELRERNLVAIGYSIENNVELDLIRDYATISPTDKAKFLKSAYSTITLSQRDIKQASKAITDIFNAIKKVPCLKIIAGKGHGSLMSLRWFDSEGHFSRVGLTRESLTNLTDLVFSNDTDDIGFYLGNNTHTPASEVTARFGGLKACVWGSDCHSIGTLLHPSNGNTLLYTWIKADPNFEGLRQVVFEPADRVRIQEEKPEQKTDYSIIDKVKFISDNKLFTEGYIEINQNMNAVIGGKSSGKSLLLYHIAKTIDPIQVDEKMKIVGEKGYEFESKTPNFDFEVIWKDGHSNTLKQAVEERNRQVTYIPQMYINHLAEEKGERKLKELIEGILKQNADYKAFLENQRALIESNNQKISAGIDSLYILRESAKKVIEEIKQIGDKAAIEGNVKKVSGEIEELRKKAGFTEDENKRYEKLVKSKNRSLTKHQRFERYRDMLLEHIEGIESLKDEAIGSLKRLAETNISPFNDSGTIQNIGDKNAKLDEEQTVAHYNSLKSRYEDILKIVQTKLAQHQTSLDEHEVKFQPFLTKISNQSLLTKLLEELEKEQLKLKQIADKEKARAEIVEEGRKVRQSLFDNYSEVFKLYQAIRTKLQQPELTQIGNNLELQSILTFDVIAFTNGFGNLIDGRSNFSSVFGSFFGDKNEYLYTETAHAENIKAMFEKISSYEKEGIKFKSGVLARDVSKKLFDDYFTFKYVVKQNSDNILQMSPGKRGLVLLQLILHLSNASHPILIDQPEDNLDNRTIYNELNDFIKEKKVQRQILIVTHNANLVVSTDSEQVIVANQQGQEQGKGNRECQFEYVTGALENTFKDDSKTGILYQMGIREHVCDILEGGQTAFQKREEKYGF